MLRMGCPVQNSLVQLLGSYLPAHQQGLFTGLLRRESSVHRFQALYLVCHPLGLDCKLRMIVCLLLPHRLFQGEILETISPNI